MMEPVWLNNAVVQKFHDLEIERDGGSYGIRDDTLLYSAIDKPKNLFLYEGKDMFHLAASYAYGIAKNHPFIDGNKRTAFLCSYTFLKLNGYQLVAPEAEAVIMMVALANGEVDEKGFAKWLRDNSKAVEK